MPEVKTALEGYYTLKEAAERLGYADTSSLRRLCINGSLPAIRVERMWFLAASVVDALDRQEVKPQGGRGIIRK